MLEPCTNEGCVEQPFPHLNHHAAIELIWAILEAAARVHYRGERQAPEWIDLGGEGGE